MKLKIALAMAFVWILAACANTKRVVEVDHQAFGAELDAVLAEVYSKFDIEHGTSIAVIKGDKVIYNKAFGYADIENKIRADENTSFYIASTTKPFTALAALLLAEKGLINMDKSLQAYFPEAKFHPEIEADTITPRHLLSHTAGIANDPLVVRTAYSGVHTPELLQRLVVESSVPAKTPFGQYSYTNVGYNIFAVILERELKQPWQQILENNIFAPLAMNRSSGYISSAKRPGWTLANNYSKLSTEPFKTLPLQKRDNTMHAGGGMIASSHDLAQFVIAQLNDGEINGKRHFPAGLIPKSQQQQAEQDATYEIYQRNGYAMGWVVGELDGEKLLHHFGGFAGHHPHVSFMPQHKIGLVVLNNEDYVATKVTSVIARFVYARLLGQNSAGEQAHNQISELVPKIEKTLKRRAAHRQERKKRPWNLSLPVESYSGIYQHPHFGEVTIDALDQQGLRVTFGNLQTLAEPFTLAESIRVELVPNIGEVALFGVNGNEVQTLKYSGAVFTKL